MTAIAARTDTAEQRSAIYARLTHRNRLVAVLRIGLPIIGGIILVGFVLRLYLGSLVPDFGFANVTIDRDNLVVEAPSYGSVSEDGTVYQLGAAKARAAIGDTDLIYLTGANFSLEQPGGDTFAAVAENAQLRLSEQLVVVEGATDITSSSGITGRIQDAEVEIGAERVRKAGEADLTFSDGTRLQAATMSFEGKKQLWHFTGVTLSIGQTPGEADLKLRPGAELPVAGTPSP